MYNILVASTTEYLFSLGWRARVLRHAYAMQTIIYNWYLHGNQALGTATQFHPQTRKNGIEVKKVYRLKGILMFFSHTNHVMENVVWKIMKFIYNSLQDFRIHSKKASNTFSDVIWFAQTRHVRIPKSIFHTIWNLYYVSGSG